MTNADARHLERRLRSIIRLMRFARRRRQEQALSALLDEVVEALAVRYDLPPLHITPIARR